MTRGLLKLSVLLTVLSSVLADGPADNQIDSVRPIPPVGAKITDEDRRTLQDGLAQLGAAIQNTRTALQQESELHQYLPDVEVFHKAVRFALDYNEIYRPKNEIPAAKRLLEIGMQRATALAQGKRPWHRATGLVVRAYRSVIDGSIQPYGLVIPDNLLLDGAAPIRLDAWFHGRGERLTELSFINQRLDSPGQFTPPNTIVLHLYGRYCNANKFAGEIDLFEAIENVKQHYPIDDNRIVVRGFSMGGAACWQFATHYAGLWAAAAPGAGFSETPEFLRVFQQETLNPTWYERKLWNWYDATSYALNLFNCPTVAYSGGADRQKQAADIMATALEKEGMTLTHIIGPDTGHRYHPESKKTISTLIDQLADKGREPLPAKIKFVTYTLRYPKMKWIEVEGLEEHWERAQIEAEITGASSVDIVTRNLTAFSINMDSGLCPLDPTLSPRVTIDGQSVPTERPYTDRSWNPHYVKKDGTWRQAQDITATELRKRPGLQGPIDDAFMDSFMMVLPTGQALNPQVAAWTQSEQQHAITHWRSQFRGLPRIKLDTEITAADIANHNLVVWGDPRSNTILNRVAADLPIRWNEQEIRAGERLYPIDRFVPTLIYPNPLNPDRYLVVNSGFTFREYDYLNNARQVAKLPDWAIIDITHPANARYPGKITDAGFFDESWQLTSRQD